VEQNLGYKNITPTTFQLTVRKNDESSVGFLTSDINIFENQGKGT